MTNFVPRGKTTAQAKLSRDESILACRYFRDDELYEIIGELNDKYSINTNTYKVITSAIKILKNRKEE